MRAAILALPVAAGVAFGPPAALVPSAGSARTHAPGAVGATSPAEAQPPAPRNPPLIGEGPGGRSRLVAWVLRSDPSNRGLSLGWRRGGFSGRDVSVPQVASAAWSGAAGDRNYAGSVAWYRTSFTAAAAGPYALRFESASYAASVWIDGRPAASHRGAYLPFEARSGPLVAGAHTVVVRVDWRDPGRQAREGFHRTWFNWGGLNGEVSVRAIGASELSEPTVQSALSPDTPSARSATVRVGVLVRNYGPSRTIAATGTLTRGAQTIAFGFTPLVLGHGQAGTATATVRVDEPALWSPSSPSMYELHMAVAGESAYSAAIGLREVSRRAGMLYLNGRRLPLRGATIQEDAPGHGDALTPADEDAVVDELKAIGANAARAQHPLDPGLLERLDAAGIVVWQGIGPVEGAGNWFSNTPRLLSEAEQQARAAAAAAALHPSIVAWNLVDEAAGNGHDGYEVHYAQAVGRWLHARLPSQLVAIDVWGEHPPARAGALYAQADAVAETDYSGWYDDPHASPDRLRALMGGRLAALARTFPGRVLLISEFGAESNALNREGSPGSYAFQSRLLATHISAYRADPRLSGMLIWVLRDYALNPFFRGGSIHGVLPGVKLIEGLNQKGLFTYGGRAKPAVAVVRRLFAGLGG